MTGKIAVVGLGLEGKDIINFLLKDKNDITLFDQKSEAELDFKGIDPDYIGAGKTQIKLVCGPDYLKNGFNDFDYVFRSPGIRPDVLKGAKVITSAIKLFFDLSPAIIIGVTGTKGKGTTSTLIYEILKCDGKDVYLVGNIGKAYLEILPKLNKRSLSLRDKESFVVMEMSSFQLFDLEKSPHIAVVLNITLDHMDWHTSREEYISAKENIVRHQKKRDYAVINADYETSKNFEKLTKGEVVLFSKNTLEKKYKENILLRGEHNLENIAAAVAVGNILKIDESKILSTVRNFKGLEHRLELVREVNNISFYNDSFSTNPQTTVAAIHSFRELLTLILGGSDKGLDYNEMAEEIKKVKNVNSVVLIGQIAEQIEDSLKRAGYGGKIFNLGVTTMEKTVKTAFENTKKGGIVLLSPATASFGMFHDYKDRGNQFKENVWKLKD